MRIVLLLFVFAVSCTSKNEILNCKKSNSDFITCECKTLKEIKLRFFKSKLESCRVESKGLIYDIRLFPGTDIIREIYVSDEKDKTYNRIAFGDDFISITKYNRVSGEVIRRISNAHGGDDFSVYYTLPNLKTETLIYSFSTDSLNNILPDYDYYDYNSSKKEYTYKSDVLDERSIHQYNDVTLFRYCEGKQPKDFLYTKNFKDGTLRIKDQKTLTHKVSNKLSFQHNKDSTLVGELDVYFQRKNQSNEIHLLMVFQGDLMSRIRKFTSDSDKFARMFRSNKFTNKKKLCKDLSKFGITFKYGKSYKNETLKRAFND